MRTSAIERVIFQYSDRCNMGCPYCYCPFTGAPIDSNLCLAIIQRSVGLGAKVVTFGGGDPFMYDSFRQLLTYSHSLGLEIHVDTNGISMNEQDYRLISKSVSLLSLPLDGPDDSIHTSMRRMNGHFDIVLDHLARLRDVPCRLKINTVVAALNHGSLVTLANLLMRYPITIWSLFQFWALGMGLQYEEMFGISDSTYNTLIAELSKMSLPFAIEAGTVRDRLGYHFFVTHTGTVYIHAKDNNSIYRYLGSIFDDRVIEEWRGLSRGTIHPGAVQRYKNIRGS